MRTTQLMSIEINSVLLEKIQFAVSRRMPDVYLQDAELDTYLDYEADAIVAHFEASLYGQKQTDTKTEEDCFSLPSSWFQMFKESYFPEWLLSRYPVQERKLPFTRKIVTHTTKICPHINKESEGDHIRFFTTNLPIQYMPD